MYLRLHCNTSHLLVSIYSNRTRWFLLHKYIHSKCKLAVNTFNGLKQTTPTKRARYKAPLLALALASSLASRGTFKNRLPTRTVHVTTTVIIKRYPPTDHASQPPFTSHLYRFSPFTGRHTWRRPPRNDSILALNKLQRLFVFYPLDKNNIPILTSLGSNLGGMLPLWRLNSVQRGWWGCRMNPGSGRPITVAPSPLRGERKAAPRPRRVL